MNQDKVIPASHTPEARNRNPGARSQEPEGKAMKQPEDLLEFWIGRRRQPLEPRLDLTDSVMAAVGAEPARSPILETLFGEGWQLATGRARLAFLGGSALAGALRVAVILYFVLLA